MRRIIGLHCLKKIYSSPIGSEVIFKGGTSLSKCFRLINRFSEDIDLAVIGNINESSNQQKEKLKNISSIVNEIIPEEDINGITQKRGMIRRTAHSYTSLLKKNTGQLNDHIILESSYLGHFEPNTKMKLNTFIYDILFHNNQKDILIENDLMPFDIQVLQPVRTFCEKIMILVHFSYTENPVDDLIAKIRHTYDLHQLLNNEEIYQFFESESFGHMMDKVGKDDKLSYRNNNEWLNNHPSEALIFKDIESIWNKLKGAYNTNLINMVFSDFPSDIQILNTLKKIKGRLSNIDWKINEET